MFVVGDNERETKMGEQTEFGFDVPVEVEVGWSFEIGDTVYKADNCNASNGQLRVIERHCRIVDENVVESVTYVVAEVDDDDAETVELPEDDLRSESDERCLDCSSFIDEDYGVRYVDDGFICERCESSALEYAGNAYVVRDGGVEHYYVTNRFAMDEYGEEPYGTDALKFNQVWKSSGGYRGYNETSIEGWSEVPGLDGWTTGWTNATTTRKEKFNAWCQSIIGGDDDDEREECPVPFAIICDVTSNVFSTAIGVWTPESDRDAFLEWLNGEYDELSEALG